MAYVEFQQPPKGKKQSREALEQQVDEGNSPAGMARPRPKSKDFLGLNFPLPSPGRSPSPQPSQPPTHSVTFKFKEMLENERPGLAAMFPMTRLPGMTEYIIISDSESEQEKEEEHVKRETLQQPLRHKKRGKSGDNQLHNAPTERPRTPGNKKTSPSQDNSSADLENEELFKIDRTFKEKLSHLTKDLGSLLAQPKSNLREFLRRREGYEPPDKNPSPRRVCHLSDDDEEQLIVGTGRSPPPPHS